jgi:hypothetical protein
MDINFVSTKEEARYYKKVTKVWSNPAAPNFHYLKLECGHDVQVIGSLTHLNNHVLCDQCRATPVGVATASE